MINKHKIHNGSRKKPNFKRVKTFINVLGVCSFVGGWWKKFVNIVNAHLRAGLIKYFVQTTVGQRTIMRPKETCRRVKYINY